MTPQRKHSELTFHLIVESAPNAMILVNSEGKIAFANVQTEILFGYDRDELLGQRMDILIPEKTKTNHPEYINNFFQSA